MIGSRIKKILAANSMTQTELAKMMNISDSKMSKILNDLLEPNMKDLVLLSEVLKVSLDELIIGDTEKYDSVVEKAVKEGGNRLTKLIKNDTKLLTRKDHKDNDAYYYIKKHDAYELLASFFLTENHLVSSSLQIYYAKTVKSLIEKGLFEQYLALTSKKFFWDLSVLAINKKEEEMLQNSIQGDSQLVVYEVVANKSHSTSQYQEFLKKEHYGVLSMDRWIIYSYLKTDFDDMCDSLIMKLNADPKFVKNEDKRNTYLPIYLSKTPKLLNELIQFHKDGKTTPFDFYAIQESLIIQDNFEEIYQLFSYDLGLSHSINLSDMVRLYEKKPQKYFMFQQKFSDEVYKVQNYFKLCVKHGNKKMFKKLISHPNLANYLKYAGQTRLNKLSDYYYSDTIQKPIDLFCFEKPIDFDQIIATHFPKLAK